MRKEICMLTLAASTLLGGCMFQHLSPASRLQESVQGLNDQTRWVRLDLAQQRVAHSYKQEFMVSRSKWGNDVQIADLDFRNIELRGEQGAESVVIFSWYSQSDMTLRTSVLRQHWKNTRGQFALTAEEVIEGDPRLLLKPTAPEQDPAKGS